MYPNILLSAIIVLIAAWIIGGILGSQKLIKGCKIAAVILVSGALIAWLLLGANPVPQWPLRLYRHLVNAVLKLAG